MTSKWENLFTRVDVKSALSEAQGMDEEQLRNLCLEYAFDTSDIRAYTLITELLRHEEKWQWHYLASLVLCQPLCHLKGAYFAAYHHATEASTMAPNDKSLKEYLLFFNSVPDKPMGDEEAKAVALELRSLDPGSELAKSILNAN